ncbi:MAG: hypothetical protein WBP63_11940, partial [Silvibacterium sp.]
ALQYLKKSAISAANKNGVKTALDRAPRLLTRGAGRNRVLHLHRAAGIAQKRSATVHNCAPAAVLRKQRIQKESNMTHIPSMSLRETAHNAMKKSALYLEKASLPTARRFSRIISPCRRMPISGAGISTGRLCNRYPESLTMETKRRNTPR